MDTGVGQAPFWHLEPSPHPPLPLYNTMAWEHLPREQEAGTDTGGTLDLSIKAQQAEFDPSNTSTSLHSNLVLTHPIVGSSGGLPSTSHVQYVNLNGEIVSETQGGLYDLAPSANPISKLQKPISQKPLEIQSLLLKSLRFLVSDENQLFGNGFLIKIMPLIRPNKL